jgi:hypothetical protein
MRGPKKGQLPKYLAYALPPNDQDRESRVCQYDDLELHDVPLRARESFIDYEGVCLFAGAFETIKGTRGGNRFVVCTAESDLDLREREFWTAIAKGKFIVFLVPRLPKFLGDDLNVDLFRRILDGINIYWENLQSPLAHIHSEVPEFQEFIERYGTAHNRYRLRDGSAKRICGVEGYALGFSIADKVFILPCAFPETHEQAGEMAVTAIRAARDYRERIREAFPEWIAEYRFEKEGGLIAKAEELRGQLLTIESEIDVYKQYKGALCFRSDPLVRVVTEVLHGFFGLDLEVEEKRVEDAALKDEQGNIVAVFEIKGVNGDFTRQNVNQVDSHRERLNLPASTPGILLMNTIMSAESLADKDQPPHPDIIKKAVADNVLLVRTLDLLRCANLSETGKLSREQFRETILGQAGWLKAYGEGMEVVRE